MGSGMDGDKVGGIVVGCMDPRALLESMMGGVAGVGGMGMGRPRMGAAE